jgi:long-chain acyl-CoA synthetase
MHALLPRPVGSRLAVAAWEEYFQAPKGNIWLMFRKWFEYNLTTIFYNIYLFPRDKGFRKSMAYTGELLDNGWSILFFPEGWRSTTGEMLPFRRGIGVMATRMRVPVVPVKLEGIFEIMPVGRFFPKRGPVTVKFGKPMYFKYQKYSEIAEKIKKTIESL